MEDYVHRWIIFLRDTEGGAAIPLIIFGGVLMILGWRMWRVCVVLSFGLLGMLTTLQFVRGSENEMLYAGLVGLVLAGISYKPARGAVGALGGLLGAGLLLYSLSGLGLSHFTVWGLAAAGLILGAAYSFLHRQHMVVLVTSFLGALMVLSGIAALCMTSPAITGTFRSMAAYSAIVIPFVILVPTVMACFYQVSEMRRLGIEL